MIRGIKLNGKAAFMRDLENFKRAVKLDDNYYQRELANFCIRIIQLRTPNSKDVYGNRPKPLKDGSPRTLYKTGKMLKAMQFRIEPGRITIYYPEGTKEKIIAEVHNFGKRSGRGKGFKMPRFEFFGFSKVEEDLIVKFAANILQKIMQKYNL